MNKKSIERRQLAGFVLLALCLLPTPSFALELEGIVDNANLYLQGSFARAFGTLALIVGGYLCLWRHVFPKEYFIMLIIGLGIIFGASSIYTKLAGL